MFLKWAAGNPNDRYLGFNGQSMYVCVWWYVDLTMGGGEKNSGLKDHHGWMTQKRGKGG